MGSRSSFYNAIYWAVFYRCGADGLKQGLDP